MKTIKFMLTVLRSALTTIGLIVGLVFVTESTLEWMEKKRESKDEWASYKKAEADFIAAN